MFIFMGARVGSFVLVMGSLMLMSLRELADYQVAQSHASRRSACRLFAVINAWSLEFRVWIDTFANHRPKQQQ